MTVHNGNGLEALRLAVDIAAIMFKEKLIDEKEYKALLTTFLEECGCVYFTNSEA